MRRPQNKREETPCDYGGGGEDLDRPLRMDSRAINRAQDLNRRVTPDDYGGTSGSDLVTTFSLDAASGAINWTTDSKAAAAAAGLGSLAGSYDCSGTISGVTYILSAGTPTVWRKLSGSTQVAIIGGGTLPAVGGELFRVLSDGSLIHGKRDDETFSYITSSDGNYTPDVGYTWKNPRFYCSRIDNTGAVSWSSTVKHSFTSVHLVDAMMQSGEISSDGRAMVIRQSGPSPYGRYDAGDEYNSAATAQAVGVICQSDGTVANNYTTLNTGLYALRPSDGVPRDTSQADFSPASGAFPPEDGDPGKWAEVSSSDSGDDGFSYTAWRNSPALWSDCSAGALFLPVDAGGYAAAAEHTLQTSPSRFGGLRLYSDTGTVQWELSDIDLDGLRSGATSLAASGDDLYALTAQQATSPTERLQCSVIRVSVSTGTIAGTIDLPSTALLAKQSVAWDGGYAVIYNNYPLDQADADDKVSILPDGTAGGTPHAAWLKNTGRPYIINCRERKANAIYVCDRGLTTATLVYLPYIAHTVLAACSDGDSRYLVVGSGNQLVGIDVTTPTAPEVIWHRSGMFCDFHSAQADGSAVTFGITRAQRAALGSLAGTIADWSDFSLPENSGVVQWVNLFLGQFPTYHLIRDNTDAGHEVNLPGSYLGDFVSVTGVEA